MSERTYFGVDLADLTLYLAYEEERFIQNQEAGKTCLKTKKNLASQKNNYDLLVNYSERFDLKKLSGLKLHQILYFYQQFARSEVQSQIQNLILRDLHDYTNTELGGVLVREKCGVNFLSLVSAEFGNNAYASSDMLWSVCGVVAHFHLHASSILNANAKFSGPSGVGNFCSESQAGDMAVAGSYPNEMHILITPLSKDQKQIDSYNIDLYFQEKELDGSLKPIVLDMGVYKWKE